MNTDAESQEGYKANFNENNNWEFDGDANYAGDYWLLAADSISALEDEITRLGGKIPSEFIHNE